MHAWIVDTGRKISPFDESPWHATFAGKTIGDDMRASFAKLRIPLVDGPRPGPMLVVADHCYATQKILGDFARLARKTSSASSSAASSSSSLRLALAKTPSVEFMLPVGSARVEPFDASGIGARVAKGWEVEVAATERVAYDCFYVADGAALANGATPADAAAVLAKLREAPRLVVPKRELGIPMRMPTMETAKQKGSIIPITSSVAAHVEHWVHILWLNQMAFGVRWMEMARTHKLWLFTRALRSFPWMPFSRVFHALVRKGKNVRVHPTAYIEASILGDDVVVGAGASVRNSILGDGVVVGDGATVLSSSLGARTAVTPRTFAVWCASYEDAAISNYKLQVSLVGRGAGMSTWAGLIDAKLQGEVEVKHDGKLHSTERSFIGSCIGHGGYVGAKVLIMPGREVPNGAFIAMSPDEIIGAVPAELPEATPMMRDRGTVARVAYSGGPATISPTESAGFGEKSPERSATTT